MRKVTFFLKKYFTHEGHAEIDRERAERAARRSQQNASPRASGTSTPASASSTSHRHDYEWPSGGNPTRSHRPPPSGVTVSDRPIGQQRPRRTRRRRRTASPVGLPLYSEEPRDQEMSLFKHQTADLSMSSSRLDLTLSPTIEVDSRSQAEDGDGEEEEVGGADSESEFVRPSFDNSTSDHGVAGGGGGGSFHASTLAPSPLLLANRPRSASDSLARLSSRNPYGSNSSSPFASRSGLIDLPPGNLNSLSPTVSRDGTSTPPRSGVFGHRPTRSSPISTPWGASSPPRPTLGRPRALTLQRVLGGRNSSSGFLPNGPTIGRSPYGQFGGPGSPGASGANSPIASRSLQRFATGSTTSINTLDISEPVAGSFVHSSFVFPKNGLPTPEQVKFIASKENLGAYGYFGQTPSEPPPFEPASPSSPSTPPPVPLSPLAAESGMTLSRGRPISVVHSPARGRSGSTASSPLARRTSPSPPPFVGDSGRSTRRHSLAQETRVEDDDADEDHDPELPFTVDEEVEEEPSNTSTELPPIVPLSPLGFDSTSRSSQAESSADRHAYPVPPPFHRLNTSSPPPKIVTQSATPIHSAHPSPALPHDCATFETQRSKEDFAP
ncbi:hypothetical protein JCM11491_006279 [Sporobolomyces phaffii]